jgi:hypothetical protein
VYPLGSGKLDSRARNDVMHKGDTKLPYRWESGSDSSAGSGSRGFASPLETGAGFGTSLPKIGTSPFGLGDLESGDAVCLTSLPL